MQDTADQSINMQAAADAHHGLGKTMAMWRTIYAHLCTTNQLTKFPSMTLQDLIDVVD